jgi:hypothetical protein
MAAGMNMKEKIVRIGPMIFMLAIATGSSVLALGQQDIIDYYWRRATTAFALHDPLTAGQTYAFTSTAYIRSLERGGRSHISDSSVVRHFFSHGHLDSTTLIRGKSKTVFPIDISVPNIFDSTYIRTMFPNDTGGRELALGFDTDSSGDARPIGIVSIDRESGTIRRLHTGYPVRSGYARFSRSFHFVNFGGWVVPDSIIETGSLRGFLINEDYRIDITISDVTVSGKAP